MPTKGVLKESTRNKNARDSRKTKKTVSFNFPATNPFKE